MPTSHDGYSIRSGEWDHSDGPLIAFFGAAVVGAVAAWYALYNQNAIGGILLFALGAGISLVISGATTAGGVGAIEDFLVASGVPGLFGAILGAGVGGYLGDRQRNSEGTS